MKVVHRYTDTGSHQLVCGYISGPIVGYRDIATVVVENMKFAAVTDYYSGTSEFTDCNRLYKIEDVTDASFIEFVTE